MNINADILNTQRMVDEKKVDELLRDLIGKSRKKIIVLDDDPTGVQTVHGVSVYTDWTKDSIEKGFAEEERLFYILTNSRGFTEDQTDQVHREIARSVEEAARKRKMEYLIISRCDSTLRGHFPLETEAIRQELEAATGKPVDGEIICPYFKEGKRFTIGDIHYVKYGEVLVPAGETEFAKDQTFGYSTSDLKEYVEEKTRGIYRKEDVTSISLDHLRAVDINSITQQLMSVKEFQKVVVNAVDDVDLKVFMTALYKAMAMGKTYLFRVAASFVKIAGGIMDKSLLTREEMTSNSRNGGIIIVGSHTDKTTRQLDELKKLSGIEFIEFDSDLVLHEEAFQKEIERVLILEESHMMQGTTVVVYTKRKLLVVEQDSKEEALLRSVKISDAVQSLVGKLCVVPKFVIAKGGITSSDIGTKALAVKRAVVLGQIRPGIPVWKTGEESRFPDVPYVIFPGNVGEDETLREAVEILQG